MKRMRTARIAVAVGLVGLAFTACGERQDDGGDDAAGSDETSIEPADEQFPDFKACMVSDSGGFDDKSFNQTSHDGMEDAAARYGVQTADAESNDPSEFEDNIQGLIDDGCNQITTVGFLLGDATEKKAKANPEVDFAIVDFAYEKAPANVKGLTFDTAGPSFLAGYLAAAQSESGMVGTFGGQNIPTVTIFMDGFAQGVDYFNEENDADVQVLGWDVAKQAGSFTNDFENKTVAQSTAEGMIDQGADIIFPVAGPAGLGGLQAAQDNDAKGIWVDTDGCESAAEYCDILLTSVMKGMDVAVETAVYESASGTFTNEVYSGTLDNEGVGLAPLHDDVDGETADKLEELKQMIIDGEIEIQVGG